MPATVIPAHATVDGVIDTPGDVTVEGRVEGDVKAGGTVRVSAGATCRAHIASRAAAIYGELIGNATCTETIAVAAGARVVGDLRAPDVSVDGGADVSGRVDLLPPDPRVSEFDDHSPTVEVRFRRTIPRMPRPVGRVPMTRTET